MIKRLNGYQFLLISIIVSAYFLALYLAYYFEVSHPAIQFFGELLTIPILLAQIYFLIIGFILFSQKNQRMLTVTGIVILTISLILTFGSFFQ